MKTLGSKRWSDAPGQKPVDLREMIFSSTKETDESIHALDDRHTLRATERLMTETPADASPLGVMSSLKQFHREAMEAVGAPWPADLTDEAVAHARGTWHVFPNTIILAAVDGSMTHRPEDFKGLNRILEEDFANIRALQKGMKSRGFSHATTNRYQESTITNFHRVLDEYLEGGGAQ